MMTRLQHLLGSVDVPRVTQETIQIEAAEGALAVRFPPSLREFLAYAPSVSFGGEEFWGLGSGLPPHLRLVDMNLSERAAGLPSSLVAIRNDGGGRLTCVDTNDGKVLEFDMTTGSVSAFASELESALEEIISYGDC